MKEQSTAAHGRTNLKLHRALSYNGLSAIDVRMIRRSAAGGRAKLKLDWADVALGSRPKSSSFEPLARTAAWSPPLRRAQSFVLEWGSTAGGPLS